MRGSRLGVMKRALILLALAATGLGCATTTDGASFEWVPGTCANASALVTSDLTADLKPSPGAPVVRIDIGGEFILDTHLSLHKANGAIEAKLIQARDQSLCAQLETAHESGAHSSLESAVKEIRLLEATVNSHEIPALGDHYEALQGIDLGIRPSDTVYFPARGYSVDIRGIAGRILIEYSVAEPTAEGVAFWGPNTPPSPELHEWLQRLLQILSLEVTADSSDISTDEQLPSASNGPQ